MGLEISHVVDTAIGNKEAQCWFTHKFMRNQHPENDPKQRDIGDWSERNGNKFENGEDKGKSEVMNGTRLARGEGKSVMKIVNAVRRD